MILISFATGYLSLNCKVMLISRKNFQLYHVNGSVLESVSSYRYLGVLISSDLSLSNHIRDIARKQVGLLYRRFYTPATLRTLYVALIRPHLEYTVPVWDSQDIDVLESVQRFTTKICTKCTSMHYQVRLDRLHLDTAVSLVQAASWPVYFSVTYVFAGCILVLELLFM